MKVAQLLLRCGASANQPVTEARSSGDGGASGGARAKKKMNKNVGATPLMLACMDPRCGVALVETLLDYEADPHAEDRKGRTAME